MHKDLADVSSDAYASETRVVVLTGEGKAFSGDGDVSWIQQWIEEPEYF